MSQPLAEQREKERHFLEQLLDTSKLESYTVPVPIMADLRKYQQVSSVMVPLPYCRGSFPFSEAPFTIYEML